MATAPTTQAPAPAPASNDGPDFRPPRTGKDAPKEGPFRMGEGSTPNPDLDEAARQAKRDAEKKQRQAAAKGG